MDRLSRLFFIKKKIRGLCSPCNGLLLSRLWNFRQCSASTKLLIGRSSKPHWKISKLRLKTSSLLQQTGRLHTKRTDAFHFEKQGMANCRFQEIQLTTAGMAMCHLMNCPLRSIRKAD